MNLIFHGEIDVLVSVNNMYKASINRKTRKPYVHLSTEASNWKRRAISEFSIQLSKFPNHEVTKQDIYNYSYNFSFPDKIQRDGENYLKIITDALQEAKIIYNDSQVRKGIWLVTIDKTVPYKKVVIDVYKE